jgi:glucose dehydrogenase
MVLSFHILALGLTAAIGWLYVYGTEHSFFWIYPWFDSLLHVLGGLVMGLWACAVALRLGSSSRGALLWVFVVALIGGGVWELFEYLFDIQGDPLDTTSDLALGLGGALAVWLLYPVFRRTQ